MKQLLVFKLLFLLVLPPGKAQKRKKESQAGIATFYADRFQGKRTASGEPYQMNGFTAAHRWLPFGTYLRVACKATHKAVVVRINDRGPHCRNRIIDLTKNAARMLGITGKPERVTLERITADEALPALALQEHAMPGGNPLAAHFVPAPQLFAKPLAAGATYQPNGSKASPQGYAMQVASYHDHESALYDAAAIKHAGFAQVYVQVPKLEDEQVYRVVVGQYKDRDKALASADKLSKAGWLGIPVRHI